MSHIKNIIKKIVPSNISRYYFFISFIIISIIINVFNLAVIYDADDTFLLKLLKSGENKTLMLSYPLSSLIKYLYKLIPHIQWYSLTISLTFLLNFYTISYVLEKTKILKYKTILLSFNVFIIIYLFTHISLNSITAFSIGTAILSMRYNIYLSMTMLILSTLLRVGITVYLIPFVLISYLIFFKNNIFQSPLALRLKILLLVVTSIILIVVSPKINPEYSSWLKYNNARALQHDFHIKSSRYANYTNLEKSILRSWYIQDEQLLPSKQIVENSPTILNAITQKIHTFNLDYLITKPYIAIIYILLLLMTINLLFIKKNFFIYLELHRK